MSHSEWSTCTTLADANGPNKAIADTPALCIVGGVK
jgi:hypothetical protein